MIDTKMTFGEARKKWCEDVGEFIYRVCDKSPIIHLCVKGHLRYLNLKWRMQSAVGKLWRLFNA